MRENFREMDRLYSENAQLKAKNENIEEENKNLEQGLKEVMEALKRYGGAPPPGDGEEMEKGEREVAAMQFPTLERMLAVRCALMLYKTFSKFKQTSKRKHLKT